MSYKLVGLRAGVCYILLISLGHLSTVCFNVSCLYISADDDIISEEPSAPANEIVKEPDSKKTKLCTREETL